MKLTSQNKKEDFDTFYANEDPWSEHLRYRKVGYQKILQEFLQINDTTNIVEIGCGEGSQFFSIIAPKKFSSYAGFDISEVAINTAKNKPPHSKRLAEFHQGGFFDALRYIEESNVKGDLVIIILESIYYLDGKEVKRFFNSLDKLFQANRSFRLVMSSLNEDFFGDIQYVNPRQLNSYLQNTNLTVKMQWPIHFSKRNYLYPIWLLMSFFYRKSPLLQKIFVHSKGARNNIFLISNSEITR